MVLGKLPVPGRPTFWIVVGRGPIALAVAAGGDCLDIFTLLCSFSPLSPSLWEMARYGLKYCLRGPLNRNNKSIKQANSVDPDEVAHYEPPHLDLLCLQIQLVRFCIFRC